MRIPIIVQVNPLTCVPMPVFIPVGDWIIDLDVTGEHTLDTSIDGPITIWNGSKFKGGQSVRFSFNVKQQGKVSCYANKVKE